MGFFAYNAQSDCPLCDENTFYCCRAALMNARCPHGSHQSLPKQNSPEQDVDEVAGLADGALPAQPLRVDAEVLGDVEHDAGHPPRPRRPVVPLHVRHCNSNSNARTAHSGTRLLPTAEPRMSRSLSDCFAFCVFLVQIEIGSFGC